MCKLKRNIKSITLTGDFCCCPCQSEGSSNHPTKCHSAKTVIYDTLNVGKTQSSRTLMILRGREPLAAIFQYPNSIVQRQSTTGSVSRQGLCVALFSCNRVGLGSQTCCFAKFTSQQELVRERCTGPIKRSWCCFAVYAVCIDRALAWRRIV
jgi:hypothetical protein